MPITLHLNFNKPSSYKSLNELIIHRWSSAFYDLGEKLFFILIVHSKILIKFTFCCLWILFYFIIAGARKKSMHVWWNVKPKTLFRVFYLPFPISKITLKIETKTNGRNISTTKNVFCPESQSLDHTIYVDLTII